MLDAKTLRKRLEELEMAAERFSYCFVSWGSGEPGHIQLGGNNSFISTTGKWWLLDGKIFNELYGLLAQSVALTPKLKPDEIERIAKIKAAFARVEYSVVLIGDGPVIPTNTPEDRDAELKRGRWYVLDGDAYEEFRTLFKK